MLINQQHILFCASIRRARWGQLLRERHQRNLLKKELPVNLHVPLRKKIGKCWVSRGLEKGLYVQGALMLKFITFAAIPPLIHKPGFLPPSPPLVIILCRL